MTRQCFGLGLLVFLANMAMATEIENRAGDDSTLQAAVKALREGRDLKAMIVAARKMRDLGNHTAGQSDALIAPLGNDSLSLRAMVLEAMARIGIPPGATEHVQRIVLDSGEDLYLRKRAVFAMGSTANRAQHLGFLVKQLGNENRDVAYYCATALTDKLTNRSSGFKEIVTALSDTLSGGDAAQQRFALFALARLGKAFDQGRAIGDAASASLRSRIRKLIGHSEPSILLVAVLRAPLLAARSGRSAKVGSRFRT